MYRKSFGISLHQHLLAYKKIATRMESMIAFLAQILLLSLAPVSSFVLHGANQVSLKSSWSRLYNTETNPVDEFSEERKANLFQFLLRDLEIEGVPLLGCDANQVHTFQAALWTTMGQLSESDDEAKACLILEDIPMDALRACVDDFLFFKSQPRFLEQLPELERISLSLVGKGVGPAIIIETAERTDEEKTAYASMKASTIIPDEMKWQGSMERFINRMMIEANVCPDLSTQNGPTAYRLVASNDACDIMSGFWSCMSEILALPEDQLGSLVMSLTPVDSGSDPYQAHQRFTALTELMSRSLFLYRGEDLVHLWYMHPLYDRDSVFPDNKPQHGHLPPTTWLRGMLSASGNEQSSELLSQDQLKLQNFQRRSPVPAVLMRRVDQIDATKTPQDGVLAIEVEGGEQEMASDVGLYSANLLKMISKGELDLQSSLADEIQSLN